MDQFFTQSTAGVKQIHTTIKADKHVHLESHLYYDLRIYRQGESATLELLTVLIHLSIIHGSASSLKSLMKLHQASMNKDDFTKDCVFPVITGIIALMGRRKFFKENSGRMPSCVCAPIPQEQMDRHSGIKLLKETLKEFPLNSQIWFCTSEKLAGRTIMYFVAKYGLLDAYELLLDHMQEGDDLYDSVFSESILLEDQFGDSPLSLALASGFEELFKRLLEFFQPHRSLDPWDWKRSSGVLSL